MTKEKLELIKRNAAEILNEDELNSLLKKKNPITYCGYEPSGEMHLGHLVTITKLLDLENAGFKVKILLADWHAWLNKKGDWNFINEQVKIWKAGFKAAGLKNAEFVVGTSFQRSSEFQDDVLTIALEVTMNRALRSMQTVGRDLENAKVSQVIYPLMQIADIKHLKIDLVQSGIEQRKIHALGIEVFDKINYKTPVFVHTPLITSLQGPGSKMSSSIPDSMISIRDTEQDIKRKMNKAYCPEGVKEDNPVLQISRLIVFPRIKEFVVNRPEKFGGNVSYNDYDNLEKDFVNKKLHPMDLKNSVAKYLCEIIEPIRKSFKV